jgi:hypothetical protein
MSMQSISLITTAIVLVSNKISFLCISSSVEQRIIIITVLRNEGTKVHEVHERHRAQMEHLTFHCLKWSSGVNH